MRQLGFVFICLFCGALFTGQPVRADQTDPALDDLFAKLQGPDAAASAAAVTREIWRRWLDSGSEDINQRMETGIIAMQAGYLRLAENVFAEVILRAPDFAEGWNKRATVRYLRSDYDGSIQDCARVLELEPRHFGALSGLGVIQVILGDDRLAIQWFERASAINPHLPGLQENISEARERLRGKAI